jgi:undecaprenyl-diphosphatase
MQQHINRHSNRYTFPLLLIALLATIVFISISAFIHPSEGHPIDEIALNWFGPSYPQAMIHLMQGISYFGSGEVIMILTGLTVGWLWIRHKAVRQALLFIVVMGGGVLLNLLLKFGFQRGRPDEVHYFDFFGSTLEMISYSYPSGHAMRAFLFFGCMIYLIRSRILHKRLNTVLSLLCLAFIALIGLSRIILEAHFPSDILAAFAVSLAWLTLCMAFFRQERVEKSIPRLNHRD